MEGKDAIIEKILSDATEKATAIVSAAEKKAKEIIDGANEWAEEYTKAQSKILEKETEEIVSRRLTNANLDVKKQLLSAKQQVIEQTFEKAYKELCSLSKEKYLKFVKKLITENAEDGDEIILSCDGVITKKDLDDGFLSQRKLTVKKETGKFFGGVILSNKTCDKDLTFRSVIESKKEQLLGEVAKLLF